MCAKAKNTHVIIGPACVWSIVGHCRVAQGPPYKGAHNHTHERTHTHTPESIDIRLQNASFARFLTRASLKVAHFAECAGQCELLPTRLARQAVHVSARVQVFIQSVAAAAAAAVGLELSNACSCCHNEPVAMVTCVGHTAGSRSC